jgi:hypothetical protein
MGPRNAYKDMLDNVVSPITCVSMNHQNQLEQMANGAMFATVIYNWFASTTLDTPSGPMMLMIQPLRLAVYTTQHVVLLTGYYSRFLPIKANLVQ